ncbi:hypothetical protein ACF3N7_05240 [Cruoricaptor ignavus]|uniref:hypothetical protein n=1 Tax=Cruoricaptor ignavus TaxID=1118202 RepID=UPI00370D2082
MESPQEIPQRIKSFLSLPDEEKKRERYKADYIGMYEYDDGSKLIILPVGKTTPPIWVKTLEISREN